MKRRTHSQLIVLSTLVVLGYLCTPSSALHEWREIRKMAQRNEAGVFQDPMKFLRSVKTVTVCLEDLPSYEVPVKERKKDMAKFVQGDPPGRESVTYADVLEERVQSVGLQTIKIWKGKGDGCVYFVVNYSKPVTKEDLYIYSARLQFGLPGAKPETIAYEIERLGIAMASELESKVMADWYALLDTFVKDCRDTK